MIKKLLLRSAFFLALLLQTLLLNAQSVMVGPDSYIKGTSVKSEFRASVDSKGLQLPHHLLLQVITFVQVEILILDSYLIRK